MIQNLIFGILFLKKIISGIQRIHICPDVPKNMIRVFFNFMFSCRKSQSQQKLAKTIKHFTIQFHSKNITHFPNLNSLNIENNMLQKTFWLYTFSRNMFLLGARKNICIAPFLTPKNCILKAFWKQMSLYFYKSP